MGPRNNNNTNASTKKKMTFEELSSNFKEACLDLNLKSSKDPVSDILDTLKAKSRESSGLSGEDNIAINVVNLLLPAMGLITMKAFDDGFSKAEVTTNKLKAGVRKNSYDVDRLEQYTRRENLRFSGVKEDDPDNLEGKIANIAAAVGVELDRKEFRCHRVGEKSNGFKPRQVIARFHMREKRNDILANRTKLKDVDNMKGVYISEDLTTLRVKLLNVAKKHDDVKNVTTRNGKIVCFMKSENKKIVIDNPDDLFKLGFDDIDYKALGLTDLD